MAVAPSPTACPICRGTGIQPVLIEAGSELARLVVQSGIRLKLTGGPCLSCRCWCGQPSTSIGGLCENHERAIDDGRRRT